MARLAEVSVGKPFASSICLQFSRRSDSFGREGFVVPQESPKPTQLIAKRKLPPQGKTKCPDDLPGAVAVVDENGAFVAYRDARLGWWYDPVLDRWRT
jgi:hypothetical protein